MAIPRNHRRNFFCSFPALRRVTACLTLAFGLLGARAVLAEPPTVKLGAILCLTGDLAMNCGAFREGIELAVHNINMRGGVKGRKIEVEVQDSGRVPKTAQAIARKFGADDQILGVITSTFFEAKNSSPALEKYGIPSVVLWDSTPELEAMGEYTFAIGPWAPSTFEESAKFSSERLHAKSAVVVATIEEWAQSVATGFEKTFKREGGEILDRIDVNAGESDFRTIVARVAIKNPDVIYAPVTPNLEVLVRQIKERSLRAPVVTSDNITTALLRANPKVLEGVYQSMVSDPAGPDTADLARKYRDHFGRQPELILFVSWAYDAVNMYARAIEAAGFDRKSIRDSLAVLKNYRGTSGVITMNPEGSSRMMASMFRVENNQLMPVK